MITIVKDTPNLFKGQSYIVSDDQKQALHTIADTVVNRKKQVIKFLQKYNYQVAETGVKEKDLLQGLTIVFNNSDDAKTDFLKLTSSSSFSNVDTYTAATVGIMNAFKSIFGAFAKPNATQDAAAIQAQLAQVIVQKQAQQARNQKIAIWVVVALVLASITGIVLYYRKQNK